MIHDKPHALAGNTATVKRGVFKGEQIVVQDYWDRVSGKSWKKCGGIPAVMHYAERVISGLPEDDEVIYGKIGPLGYLIHCSEMEDSGAEELITIERGVLESVIHMAISMVAEGCTTPRGVEHYRKHSGKVAIDVINSIKQAGEVK